MFDEVRLTFGGGRMALDRSRSWDSPWLCPLTKYSVGVQFEHESSPAAYERYPSASLPLAGFIYYQLAGFRVERNASPDPDPLWHAGVSIDFKDGELVIPTPRRSVASHDYLIAAPTWFVLIVGRYPIAVWFIRHRRRVRRERQLGNQCLECGYDLRQRRPMPGMRVDRTRSDDVRRPHSFGCGDHGLPCIITGMKRPVIGLTTDYNDQKQDRYLSTMSYAGAIEKAGGLPVLLPYAVDHALIPQYVDLLDGICFTGGDDMNPVRYGEEWHPKVSRMDERREQFEFALLAEVEKRRLPALGVCFGSQLMNVYRGGSLTQFLPEHVRNNALEHRRIKDQEPTRRTW